MRIWRAPSSSAFSSASSCCWYVRVAHAAYAARAPDAPAGLRFLAQLTHQSGKPQFGYIYGTALLGVVSIYSLLNLMSPSGIDAYRTASVLGYCLLPLVIISLLSIAVSFECARCRCRRSDVVAA